MVHRDTSSSFSCRQIQGQQIKLINQTIIGRKDRVHSFPRRLIAYIREAWTGMISGEDGKTLLIKLEQPLK